MNNQQQNNNMMRNNQQQYNNMMMMNNQQPNMMMNNQQPQQNNMMMNNQFNNSNQMMMNQQQRFNNPMMMNNQQQQLYNNNMMMNNQQQQQPNNQMMMNNQFNNNQMMMNQQPQQFSNNNNMMMNKNQPQQGQINPMMNNNMMMQNNLPQQNMMMKNQQPQLTQQQMMNPQQQQKMMMMNQQLQQQQQQEEIEGEQQQQQTKYQYRNPEEILLYPMSKEDFILTPDNNINFQKPSFDISSLPQELQQDIQQNETLLSQQSLQPLVQITGGRQWGFFIDYLSFLKTNTKVTPEQETRLCSILTGNLLSRWVEALIAFFKVMEEESQIINPKFIMKCFLDGAKSRHITFSWKPPNDIISKNNMIPIMYSKRSTHGCFIINDQGVIVIYLSPQRDWETHKFLENFLTDGQIVKHERSKKQPQQQQQEEEQRSVFVRKEKIEFRTYPLCSIEGGCDMYGCIESHLYFCHYILPKLEASKLELEKVFGTGWNFKVDIQKVFSTYNAGVKDPKIDIPMVNSYWIGNYVLARKFCKGSISQYFTYMIKRMLEAVKCNGQTDPKLVKAINDRIKSKTIELRFEPKDGKGKGCYELKVDDETGSFVILVIQYHCNMDTMFLPSPVKSCIEILIFVEKIPILAYKNHQEKALPKLEEAKQKLKEISGGGKEWNVEYKLPLTFKKLVTTHTLCAPNMRNMRYPNETFPSCLISYFERFVSRVQFFAKKFKELTPPDDIKQEVLDADDLDSEEEEEILQNQDDIVNRKTFPFTIQQILESNIPSNTVVIKYLNKLKNPIDPYVFGELKDGKLIIKIIKWCTNMDQTLNSRNTSFESLMKSPKSKTPIFVELEYFEKFAKKETELLNEIKQLLGTQSNWTYEVNLEQIYNILSTSQERDDINNAKGVGRSIGLYLSEFMFFLRKYISKDPILKAKFLERFGEKRTIRLVKGPGKQKGGGGKEYPFGFTACSDEDGVLQFTAYRWCCNMRDGTGKVMDLLK